MPHAVLHGHPARRSGSGRSGHPAAGRLGWNVFWFSLLFYFLPSTL
jgi:hypothetical protein